MALFNRGDRRFYQNIFGGLNEIPAEVTINAAGVLTRAVGAAATSAASSFLSPGTTRSGASFRTPGSGQGKQVIRKSAGDDTGRIVRRRISIPSGPPETQAQTMSSRQGNDGEEVPVIPPPKRISKIAPDYTTIQLPYYAKVLINSSLLGGTNYLGIRLNSVYDPIVGATVDQQPQGRDQWAGIFNFYRVLQSDVKLTFLNNNYQGGAPDLPSRTIYAVGYELIDAGQEVSNSVDAFMITKHAKRELLGAGDVQQYATGAGASGNKPSVQVVTHMYRPEMWDYHVQELGTEERWTPILQNPTNDHFMAVRVFDLGGQGIGTDRMEVLVQINYTVQFREVRQPIIKQLDGTDATYGGAGEDPADTV